MTQELEDLQRRLEQAEARERALRGGQAAAGEAPRTSGTTGSGAVALLELRLACRGSGLTCVRPLRRVSVRSSSPAARADGVNVPLAVRRPNACARFSPLCRLARPALARFSAPPSDAPLVLCPTVAFKGSWSQRSATTALRGLAQYLCPRDPLHLPLRLPHVAASGTSDSSSNPSSHPQQRLSSPSSKLGRQALHAPPSLSPTRPASSYPPPFPQPIRHPPPLLPS